MTDKVQIDKIGSVTSRLSLGSILNVSGTKRAVFAGDVVAVRALTESVTYGDLETCTGRLARINAGDILCGALGARRALKGFVGDVPETIKSGDRLNLLNMGGVFGECKGHHSSFGDAIAVEVIGSVCTAEGSPVNIADGAAIRPAASLRTNGAPIVLVAGTCMNSGKTVAAAELVKQAARSGLRVAGAKLSGIACLRDTLLMKDNGAFATASFLDLGLPSTVDRPDLNDHAKGIFNHLNEHTPDVIIAELGDGIVGGYSVDAILADREIRSAVSAFVFCASDYVGVTGGIAVLREYGIEIDIVAGSVTDAAIGEDFVNERFGLTAGNARRAGDELFTKVMSVINSKIPVSVI